MTNTNTLVAEVQRLISQQENTLQVPIITSRWRHRPGIFPVTATTELNSIG